LFKAVHLLQEFDDFKRQLNQDDLVHSLTERFHRMLVFSWDQLLLTY